MLVVGLVVSADMEVECARAAVRFWVGEVRRATGTSMENGYKSRVGDDMTLVIGPWCPGVVVVDWMERGR